MELVLHTADLSVPYLLPESVEVDNCYEVKIENIYDPSKFWIVIQFKELRIFMRYLRDFYSKPGNRKTVDYNKLEKNLLCIICKNQMFYRCMVQPLLLPDKNKVRVFLIDYGLIINVSIGEIFYIFKKHCTVPRFAIRACLANISPFDSLKAWSQTDLKSFCALIEGKRLLVKIYAIDTVRCVLFVDVRIFCETLCKSVNNTLVSMRLATYDYTCRNNEADKLKKYKSKVRYLHLFPTFEALENGTVPCSLWEYDLLKDSVPLDLLYKNYYLYQDNSNAVN